ncbi:LysR family transcriptional regulator [Nocardia carnea]|uniref:LysR family transcriptional regulator n=1 Tax=Nocardia carnea TaxID=37328 RepID=UPI0024570F12|nr:LysR family transcriptional regulator [Nocardia carnea]
MELRDVEIFLVVAEELNFTRAARRLGLSTARVSQVIQVLEKDLGGALFLRTTRRVELSPLGARFRIDAERGAGRLYSAIVRTQAAARSRTEVLRLGHSPLVSDALVAHIADRCEAYASGITVTTTSDCPSTGFDRLQNNASDVLLAWSPGGSDAAVAGGDRRSGPILASAARALLVRKDHPLAGYRHVSIEQVAACCQLLDTGTDGPAAYTAAWTPSLTPQGAPLRRSPADLFSASPRRSVCIHDAAAWVQREGTPTLVITPLSCIRSYPGLRLIPVVDLPPCVLVPVWCKSRETHGVRLLIQSLAEPRVLGSAEHGHPPGDITASVHSMP